MNDSEYDAKDVLIFNDGEAGVVENVVISRVEKKPDNDGTNHPNWKIWYKSTNGGEVGEGYYYPDGQSTEDRVKKTRTALKHLAHAVLGKDYSFPIFNSDQEMMDGIMRSIGQQKADKKFRVFATYGTSRNPSQYIQIRRYPPFIESMSVQPSTLHKSSIDWMERVVPDSQGQSTVVTAATEESY